MSAPSKGSRWGSLLQQAVAGVESRLDNLLEDKDQGPNKQAARPQPTTSTPPPRTASPSTKSANDRLQERLARAVAAKNAPSSASSPKPDASTISLPRSSTDAATPLSQSPRPSADASRPESPVQPATVTQTPPVSNAVPGREDAITEPNATPPPASESVSEDSLAASANSNLIPKDRPVVEQGDGSEAPTDIGDSEISLAIEAALGKASEIYAKRVNDLEQTLEDITAQHQEELHGHVEQIDALQSKLQYLAREATENARQAASNAAPGSPEKKAAEKDQQIAQLMDEGQKLANTEQKHRAIIKKLRTQITGDEKELNELRLWRQKTETELLALRKRSRQADDLEKAHEESQKLVGQIRRDAEKQRAEVGARDSTITELKAQLQEQVDRAKSLAVKVNDEAREIDQRRIKELEDAVAALELEKNLAADRSKLQATELREKAERATERTRAVELELKGEVQALESKLETVRARAEEASSGAGGDAQVKLLRQVETLQTQYSIASENWQGIEASLVARAASLEKERDDAQRRESEMRRKARDMAARSKRLEEDLEEAKTHLPNVQRDLSSYQIQLETLTRRAEAAESALADARADFEKQRASWKDERLDRVDSERRPWLEDAIGTTFRPNSRPNSPLLSPPQRTNSSDYLGFQGFSTKLRKTSAPSSNGEPSPGERPSSARRISTLPSTRPSPFSTPSIPSAVPSSFIGGNEAPYSTSTHPLDREDMFDGIETPASPQNVVQDVVSVSTIGAGPSVQLVERMSAAIRRLESEKVAAKEELARISNQRDEARVEIVALMKEVEMSKSSTKKVEELQKEIADINERYQTTLEMLGEKSELVEELRADVEDVKAMYRDLVERTVK